MDLRRVRRYCDGRHVRVVRQSACADITQNCRAWPYWGILGIWNDAGFSGYGWSVSLLLMPLLLMALAIAPKVGFVLLGIVGVLVLVRQLPRLYAWWCLRRFR
ncbi:MAG TPA: hypothetical protein VEX38_00750 [Fimbriimonadaceae bacterium]|nr:hypothetical protein [Fimbriimonadaceae bacterium]